MKSQVYAKTANVNFFHVTKKFFPLLSFTVYYLYLGTVQ